MVKKAFYGISAKTGKILIFGDVDNFPKKKRRDGWAWVVMFCCIVAVGVSLLVVLATEVPLGK